MIRLLITSPLTLLCIQFLCMPLSYVDIPPLIGFSSCRPFLLFHLSSLVYVGSPTLLMTPLSMQDMGSQHRLNPSSNR